MVKSNTLTEYVVHFIRDEQDLSEVFAWLESEEGPIIDNILEDGDKPLGIIQLDKRVKKARYTLTTVSMYDSERVKEKWFYILEYSRAIYYLVKYGVYPKIKSEFLSILTDDQFFVWYLKEICELSYGSIAELREIDGKSGSLSTIRDLYRRAKYKVDEIEQFCKKFYKENQGGYFERDV